MTDLGGFLVKLTLQSPQSDFNRVKQDLKDVRKEAGGFGNDFKTAGETMISILGKMTAAALAFSAALSKIAISSATAAAATTRTNVAGGVASGISAQRFMTFTNAAIRVGMDPSALGGVLESLQKNMQGLKIGQLDTSFATNMAMLLGVEKGNLLGMKERPTDQIALQMIQAYEGAADKEKAFRLLQELAPALAEFVARPGGGTEALAASKYRTASFTASEWAALSAASAHQGNLAMDWKAVGDTFNAEMALVLDKFVVGIDKWFNDPKNKKAIDEFIKAIGKLVDVIGTAAGWIMKTIFGDKSTLIGAHSVSALDMLTPEGQARMARDRKVTESFNRANAGGKAGTLSYTREEVEILAARALMPLKDLPLSMAQPQVLANLNDMFKMFDDSSDRLLKEVTGAELKREKDDKGGTIVTLNIKGDLGVGTTKFPVSASHEYNLVSTLDKLPSTGSSQ